jgi:hypothetical protein
LPQKIDLKTVSTFNKGLFTEATVMTFPEGTTSDELNCDLLKNGARQRRRAIQFEDNYQNSSFTVNANDFIHTEKWENVSGIGGTEFLVVQVNNMVYFYDKSGNTVSANQKPFSIDLYNYDVANSFNAASTAITCSSITGYLVIVSPAINPIKVEYFSDIDNISVEPIIVKIRDFEFLGMSADILSIARTTNVVTVVTKFAHSFIASDTVKVSCSLGQFNGTFTVASAPTTTTITYNLTGSNLGTTTVTGVVNESRFDRDTDVTPSKATSNYNYDLYNQGWFEPGSYKEAGSGSVSPTPYDAYGNNGRRPRNKPWYTGSRVNNDGVTVLDIATYRSTSFGKTLAPNGYYILDFFNQNRSTASTIPDLTTIVEPARFSATVAYAGRVWYAGLNSAKNGGKIFFTKIVESSSDFEKCYQIASPTSQDTAGVVDSDGGVIIIPDASDIKALYSAGSNLFVFASNGVWVIGGVDQVFKATEYYVYKISNFGILNKKTLVDVSGTPIFWGSSGIYTVASDQNGKPALQSISDPIKSFYEAISNSKKMEASSVFDRLNKRIYWMYPTEDETVAYKKKNILIFDIDLQAFIPWKVSDSTGTTPYILDAMYLSGLGSAATTFNILSGVDQVIDSSSNTVVQTLSETTSSQTEVKFIVRTSGGYLTFAEFNNRSFLDWGTATYSSFAETGYDFFGNATIKKNAPFITSYMKRTEENYLVSGSGYITDYPSSCILLAKWDLSNDSSRWSNPSQIYRMVNPTVVDPNDLTFSYPYDTIVARTKIRGKGRVMRMRFESEQGKDFYLIGWEVISGSNPRY